MLKQVNTTFKKRNAIAILALSAALTFPMQSYAQDLPELAPAEAQEEALDINDVLQEIDATLPPEGSAVEQIVPETVGATTAQPETNELAEPMAANTEAAIEQAGNIPDIPSLNAADEEEETLFFDADTLVPQGEVARRAAPRRVSPVTEPGSKLIIVKKDHGKDSRRAGLVAAERAMKLGRYASALKMYEDMYAKNKRDPNILMGRAEAYQRLGENDFAIQAYEELLDLRPNNIEARINMLGIIGQKFPAVALRQLMDLREDNPDNVGIVAQIAVVQAKLGDFDDAIRYLGIAASIEPQNPAHIFNMAVIADKAGDKKQAVTFYEQALEIDTLYGKGGAIPRDAVFERLASLR